MLNVKEIVYKELSKHFDNVTTSYPQDWEHFPIILLEEENNSPHTITDDKERITSIAIKIDIWTKNESTSTYMNEVNDVVSKLGLIRKFCQDAPELNSNLRHKVMRFDGDVDVQTQHVYHD